MHTSPQGISTPLHTELNIEFERLGIRFLRRMSPSNELTTRLVSEVMLYGLSAQGTVSNDVLIQGKLEGIRITDLTTIGKKFPNILLMGTSSGLTQEATPTNEQSPNNCLSFHVNRSPRPLNSIMPNQQFDVHLSAFVPTIQYTHSVNFIYEIELFISKFKSYSAFVSNSFKTAAVGVAKGLVSRDSKLVKGLSKIHSSFGQSQSQDQPSFTSEDLSDIKEWDSEDASITQSKDRIFFNFSVQSPVIIVPSSLNKDNCLVAHLGEISVHNEFIGSNGAVESSVSGSTLDRLTISVTRVSLHATRDESSRQQLLHCGSSLTGSSGKCFKVLRETSAMLQVHSHILSHTHTLTYTHTPTHPHLHAQVDRRLGPGEQDQADLVITGKICDPLLVKLPKEVFDQIQYTLKHGIRHKPRTMPTQTTPPSHNSEDNKSTTVIPEGDPLPNIYASFSLPKLSLELKHTLEGKEKNLVYISFDGFSVQVSRREPQVMNCELLLKSIVIEDLLQPEDSEYRYILASSIQPLSMMSPVNTPSRNNLSSLSMTGSLPSLSRHFFPLSQLMSTPKLPTRPLPSPLRTFDPHSEDTPTNETQEEESDGEYDILTIRALYIDKNCPHFNTTYKSVRLSFQFPIHFL